VTQLVSVVGSGGAEVKKQSPKRAAAGRAELLPPFQFVKPVADFPGVVRVIPFKIWCEMRGLSEWNARRLVKDGKVKVTQLSPRRVGIRTDHDAEYLAACERIVSS
jgi:hypothetical protein